MKKWLWVFLLTLQLSLGAYHINWDQYKAETLPHLAQIHGWCTPEKAEQMMDLIYETHPKICVEIGVFGGSSIFPTARALKYLGAGIVYAIDPWAKEECAKGYAPDDPNYDWWTNKVDLDFIYNHFTTMLRNHSLFDYCAILRMTSSLAHQIFSDESIDILHVDGNHTEQAALEDVQMYLPRVKKGGYIWFDDANWSTTHLAVQYLNEHCIHDEKRSTSTCFLYIKKGP